MTKSLKFMLQVSVLRANGLSFFLFQLCDTFKFCFFIQFYVPFKIISTHVRRANR